MNDLFMCMSKLLFSCVDNCARLPPPPSRPPPPLLCIIGGAVIEVSFLWFFLSCREPQEEEALHSTVVKMWEVFGPQFLFYFDFFLNLFYYYYFFY
jgi:hypothetical protein